MKIASSKITLYATIFIIITVIVGLFFIGRFGFNALSGARAFVGGEGLWSKNQKNACYQLVQYLYTRDMTKYEAFLHSLLVPLGDKKARLELEKKDSDLAVVFRGLLEGGNHPDDLESMVYIYKKFGNNKDFRKSIESWQIGDQLITELLELGEIIKRQISSGDMTQAVFNENLARIDDLQSKLNSAEINFSFHMANASRWAVHLLLNLMLVFTVIGSAICIGMLFLVGNILSTLKKYSEDLEITAETERVIKKELVQEKDNLQKALAEIKTLRGIVPICSYCKKIRNDKGAWDILESYISKHTEAEFSHGACPDCYKKQMAELERKD